MFGMGTIAKKGMECYKSIHLSFCILLLLLTSEKVSITRASSDITCGRFHPDEATQRATADAQCAKIDVCKKSFHLSLIQTPPYDSVSIEEFLVRKCCGNCTKITRTTSYHYMFEIKELYDSSSKTGPDFVFPVLERTQTDRAYGYHFVPVVQADSFLYVSPTRDSTFKVAIKSCMNLYPLILIGLLMSVDAGFLVWAIETWRNEEEFPRKPFFYGWSKGIWWSVVSFTQTGMERPLKSVLARILSVIWVIVSAVMMAMLTSIITAALMHRLPSPQLSGRNVGVLKRRLYDEYWVAKAGGSMVTANNPSHNMYDDFRKLIDNVTADEIHGFLIDRFMFYQLVQDIIGNNSVSDSKRIDFLYTAQRTRKQYAEDMSFGALVKDKDVFDFFKDAVEENWLFYRTDLALYTVNMTKDDYERVKKASDSTLAALFSPSDEHSFLAIAVFGGILVAICIFGIFFEIYQRKCGSTSQRNVDIDMGYVKCAKK